MTFGHCKLSNSAASDRDLRYAVKAEISNIWGDYFKQPQFEQFPDTNTLVHNIMLTASSCKQSIERDKGTHLLNLVNEFAASFWASKNIDTFIASCPYPPTEKVIYPKLSNSSATAN